METLPARSAGLRRENVGHGRSASGPPDIGEIAEGGGQAAAPCRRKGAEEILRNEFNIPTTREIEEGVRDMCSLGMAIQKHGEQMGKVKLILSAMRKQGWGVEEVLDVLGVDESEREALAASVREELARADA